MAVTVSPADSSIIRARARPIGSSVCGTEHSRCVGSCFIVKAAGNGNRSDLAIVWRSQKNQRWRNAQSRRRRSLSKASSNVVRRRRPTTTVIFRLERRTKSSVFRPQGCQSSSGVVSTLPSRRRQRKNSFGMASLAPTLSAEAIRLLWRS